MVAEVPSIPTYGSPQNLSGWAPVSFEFGKTLPIIKWRELSKTQFLEPFFYQTLDRVRAENIDAEVTTGIDELLRVNSIIESVKPTGFIYHVSRCGSTLVSNVLHNIRNSLVISEAQPVSAAVWLFFDKETGSVNHDIFRGLILQAAVRTLGQRVSGLEQNYFLKLANVDILQVTQITRIWPDVPWVFMIRNPAEVIVSNLRKDSTWIRIEKHPEQSAMMLGCGEDEVLAMSREEYGARMIGASCAFAAKNAGTRSLFVDYTQLNFETIARIIRFFGVDPASDELSAIERDSQKYSKNTSLEFRPDSQEKLREASPLIHRLCDRWAAEGYNAALDIAKRQALTL